MNHRWLNLSAGLLFFMLLICFTGCQEPVIEVDPEDLNLVDQYVDELSLTLLDTEPDLLGWVREPYSENYPLKYNEERIEFLSENLKRIWKIREKRQKDFFPAEDTIAQWQLIVVRGSDEWFLEGVAIVGALARLETLSDRVEQAISMIIDSEGILDYEQSEVVITLIEEMSIEIEEINKLFYK